MTGEEFDEVMTVDGRSLRELHDAIRADPEHKCPFRKDGRCGIYEVRPFQCRMGSVIDSKLFVECNRGMKPEHPLTEKEGEEMWRIYWGYLRRDRKGRIFSYILNRYITEADGQVWGKMSFLEYVVGIFRHVFIR
jgi:Fe-S-cluster containining protein